MRPLLKSIEWNVIRYFAKVGLDDNTRRGGNGMDVTVIEQLIVDASPLLTFEYIIETINRFFIR